ncbi:aminotransferase class I/II-fold pyridoxal phosphate-dependent enzyme [Gorillibacterium sp. CAU 1737]|uniref:pyridoxal phosphate-dependent aminotransferase n=1 Tax=Gorillibacterium sp. CAU 1737 TaxID=3140362 RepID=UPI0032611A52
MLETYGHGGDWQTASRLYEREDFVDFSSNMNPLGPPSGVREILQGGLDWLTRYPDPAVRELRRKLAALHRIPEEAILVGNGAAELIDLAIRQLQPSVVRLAKPCFGEYEEAARKIGARVEELPLPEEAEYRLRVEQVTEKLALASGEAWHEATRKRASEDMRDGTHGVTALPLWVLGHPNNPTGQLLDPAIPEAIRAAGEPLLLDEAFMEFVERESEGAFSYVRRAAEDPNLLVLRSMTKFYAIPGIRLGYIVSHPERIEQLRHAQIPWSVNGLAQAIGCAVVDDPTFVKQTEAWLAEERPWLTECLQELGLTVTPSSVNYVLAQLPAASGWTAPLLQQAMGRRGVLIRDASRMGQLTPLHVRLAIKTRRDHERLLAALAECLRLGPSAADAEGRAEP